MPPKGTRTSKSAQTFASLLATATTLFQEKGYANTTIRDIARASGMPVGALYYYCRSKEELVLRFYERINAEVIEAFQTQTDAPASLPETFAAFLRLKLQHLAPYRDLLRVVMKEAIDPDSAVSPFSSSSSATLEKSVSLFGEMIERNRAAKAEEVEAMARALWLAHMGVLAYWLHDRSENFEATDRAIDLLAALLRLSDLLLRVPGAGKLRSQFFALISALFPERKPAEASSQTSDTP